jgi:hypothetical protein
MLGTLPLSCWLKDSLCSHGCSCGRGCICKYRRAGCSIGVGAVAGGGGVDVVVAVGLGLNHMVQGLCSAGLLLLLLLIVLRLLLLLLLLLPLQRLLLQLLFRGGCLLLLVQSRVITAANRGQWYTCSPSKNGCSPLACSPGGTTSSHLLAVPDPKLFFSAIIDYVQLIVQLTVARLMTADSGVAWPTGSSGMNPDEGLFEVMDTSDARSVSSNSRVGNSLLHLYMSAPNTVLV